MDILRPAMFNLIRLGKRIESHQTGYWHENLDVSGTAERLESNSDCKVSSKGVFISLSPKFRLNLVQATLFINCNII